MQDTKVYLFIPRIDADQGVTGWIKKSNIARNVWVGSKPAVISYAVLRQDYTRLRT